MPLRLRFAAAVSHKSGTAAHRLGTHKSVIAAAGDGFQKQNQDGCESTASYFHFEVQIKIAAPDPTVLGQRVREVSDVLVPQRQHFPTFTLHPEKCG